MYLFSLSFKTTHQQTDQHQFLSYFQYMSTSILLTLKTISNLGKYIFFQGKK